MSSFVQGYPAACAAAMQEWDRIDLMSADLQNTPGFIEGLFVVVEMLQSLSMNDQIKQVIVESESGHVLIGQSADVCTQGMTRGVGGFD